MNDERLPHKYTDTSIKKKIWLVYLDEVCLRQTKSIDTPTKRVAQQNQMSEREMRSIQFYCIIIFILLPCCRLLVIFFILCFTVIVNVVSIRNTR